WGREHASNLGPMLGFRLHEEYGLPVFTADPVTVDEMDGLARVSGVPEIARKSNLHALNIKAVLRRAASELGVGLADKNFVVAHMGGGTSVAAVRRGAIVDVNNALLGMGPFSPLRAGALPIGDLLEMAYSGRYEKGSLMRKLTHESGLMGYLGTSDVREVERRIDSGDEYASSVFEAMAYQVAKEIAAMASVLGGDVEAVLLTGGVANSGRFTGLVQERVGFVARVIVYPGEYEMESLAWYALRALTGEERILEYG
ncbi:MAG TPA: butyrate kinase, partial [Isosphaeraceae bacterium]|nr:butyrate kinase [Isosphaeraceae bacterium]